MKIILKDKWGFLFFKRYSFYLEDDNESLSEVVVTKEVWDQYNVGDVFTKQ